MAALGLHGFAGPSLVSVLGLLFAVASLIAEHRLEGTWTSAVVVDGLNSRGPQALEHRLGSCGAWA